MNSSLTLLFLVLMGITLVASAPSMMTPNDLSNMSFMKVAMAESNPNCTSNNTCIGKGDSCKGDETKKLFCADANSCCPLGLYCISGTCQTDNMGQSCNNSLDCQLPLTAQKTAYNCLGNVCVYQYLPGETCTNSSDCFMELPCNVNTSTCQGIAPGGKCSDNRQCSYGNTCKSGICAALTANGGNCQANGNCYPGLSCMKGICGTPNTQTAGGSCYDNTNCASGFGCQISGTCVAVNTSLTLCTNSSDCTGAGMCICSLVTGNSFCAGKNYLLNPCTDETITLDSCLALANCTYATDAPNSCCYANCLSDYKKTFSCSCSLQSDVYGSCLYNEYCGGFPTWAIIVIIVVAIILVLAIVLLVFFMMRRRRQYDSI